MSGERETSGRASGVQELALRLGSGISEVGIQVLCMLVVLVAMVGFTAVKQPQFLSLYQMQTTGREVAILSMFAIGQGMVIIAGGIDLSVGSVLCFVGTLSLYLMQAGWPIGAVIAVAILFAVGVGALHGVLVCYLNLQPFIVTLCSLLVWRSLARWLTNDATTSYQEGAQPLFFWLGNGKVGPVPVPVAIVLVVLLVSLFIMRGTVHGRYLYAIGYNLEAARFSGVRVNALRIFTYAFCGLLTGIAGLIDASSVSTVAPSSAGTLYELYGITAAVLGGCALTGGQGSLIGIIIGAAILKILYKALLFLGVSSLLTDAVTGVVLVAAVFADALIKRRRSAT
ncbi:MAG: ABC transporter permease [Phycisphaerae bacterium]|nr:ABC transporter permease [Phycisphaerae bacterium]